MAVAKKSEKQKGKKEVKNDTLWRKPITLDSVDDDDPLAQLYQGREVVSKDKTENDLPKKRKAKTTNSADKKIKNPFQKTTSTIPKKSLPKKKTEKTKDVNKINKKGKSSDPPKVTEGELKNLLKIKSDNFQFTDIREILRGNSFDIYAYLRFLAGDAGVCKIKHQDLMQILDISRPTLFKQSDWLVKLSLIEKHSVPGDHLGTSYIVHLLEDVLPISETIIEQIQTYIEKFNEETV